MAFNDLLTPTLEGWRMAGKGGFAWTGDGVESRGGSGLLWYAQEAFGDFILTVDWRLARGDDNSGVFLRIPPLNGDIAPAIAEGYEVQIDDRGWDPAARRTGSAQHLSGAVYRLAPAMGLASHGIGQWNSFTVLARGPEVCVRLNGVWVAKLAHGARRASGHIALQAHHEGSAVRFRNLRVRNLGA
jgi:hypothetical protein